MVKQSVGEFIVKTECPSLSLQFFESTMIEGQQVTSMSMLTINATNHPFMNQFHKPEDEKRSIIVIPEEYRNDWLNCKKDDADQFFFEMPIGEFTADYFPKPRLCRYTSS